MTNEEQGIYERLQLRPVFIVCPLCRFVIRRVSEAADTPTAATRVATEPCVQCRSEQKQKGPAG